MALFNKPALNVGAETLRIARFTCFSVFLFCKTFLAKKCSPYQIQIFEYNLKVFG